MRTQERIKKLEQRVETLWRVLEDERLWHPSVVREIMRRSRAAKRHHARGRLRKAEEILA